MNSIRNLFQRLHRQAKSGAEPEGKTVRQKEVLRLAYFLRRHISTSQQLTCYKSKKTPQKSDPQADNAVPHIQVISKFLLILQYIQK